MGNDLFEDDSEDEGKIEVKIEEISANEGETTPQINLPKKGKKPRKPLSDARKAQLREQLKRGRETSLKKRQEGKKKKGLMKVKKEEVKIAVATTPPIENKVAPSYNIINNDNDLEEKITVKIMKRLKKEAEEEKKNNELIYLRKQVEELKTLKAKPKKLETIPEEPPVKKVVKDKPPEPPTQQVYNKFSPNHFMFSNVNPYN
tara:strand:- start:1915 stop:2523 length:609 start_codon:yes stop_codon:yes gene_type:complete